jgi:hypothetical protein
MRTGGPSMLVVRLQGRTPNRCAVAHVASSRRLYRLPSGTESDRCLGDAAAADASGANHNSLDPAVDERAHLLQIGLPSALGLVVRVAYVISDRRLLSANGTVSHCWSARLGSSTHDIHLGSAIKGPRRLYRRASPAAIIEHGIS